MKLYSFHKNKRILKYVFITMGAIFLFVMIIFGEALLGVCKLDCIFSPMVWAKTEIVPDVLDSFKEWYRKVTSLQADFYQITLHPLWGEKQEAKGEVWFKKPGLMHWKYLSPQQDVIIINQEGFFWYVPEDNQVIKREKKEAFMTISPMSILGENMQLEKDFKIIGMNEILQGKDKDGEKEDKDLIGYAILLKPRDAQMGIKKIIVEVRAKQFSLAAIEVEEASGNRNRIEFEKFKINQKMSPELFRFTPFPGMKIITPEDFPAL